jgi:hypothetical protein
MRVVVAISIMEVRARKTLARRDPETPAIVKRARIAVVTGS